MATLLLEVYSIVELEMIFRFSKLKNTKSDLPVELAVGQECEEASKLCFVPGTVPMGSRK